jgi:cell division protease FtsH
MERQARKLVNAVLSNSVTMTMMGNNASEQRLTLQPEEGEPIAYHEPGHALLGLLHPGGDRVRQTTVVPHG